MLKINGLTKKFKKFKAIDSFSFEFNNGIYGLLGPNGAGKTTLLRCISKLYPVDNGVIFYNGQDINENKDYLECIGYLPQLFGMYKDLSVKEMMLMMANLKNIDLNNSNREIERVIKVVNLEEKMNAKVSSLSGGMIRRLGIAQALLGKPKIIIFDEPTAGLDKHFREKFLKICTELVADGEKSILIATHITEELDRIADYIAYMQKGRMLFYTESYKMCERFRIVTGEDYKCNLIPDEAVVYKEKNTYSTSAMVVNSEWYRIDDGLEKHIPDIREFMYYFVKGGEKNAKVIAEKYFKE